MCSPNQDHTAARLVSNNLVTYNRFGIGRSSTVMDTYRKMFILERPWAYSLAIYILTGVI